MTFLDPSYITTEFEEISKSQAEYLIGKSDIKGKSHKRIEVLVVEMHRHLICNVQF